MKRFSKILPVLVLALAALALAAPYGQAETKEITVLIRMMDMQDQWFRSFLIPKAEKALGVKINVATFNKVNDIETMVKLERESGNKSIALVKTDQSEVVPMVKLGNVLALDQIVSTEQLKNDLSEYTEPALTGGTVDGKVYYIPRKVETNVFLYLQSKVDDAVDNWEPMQDEISAMFKKQNGYGLPKEYELEEDPNQWDWFDLAVVSYYWSRTEGEDGLTGGRMAQRGKDYGGTTIELLTKLYQAGGSNDDFYQMTSDPALDVFVWESFYVHNGLYNPSMYEQSWSGGGIWKGFAQGQVYGAFMHQIDAFFIHGGSNPSMNGYLQNPDEMALAIMPKGVSLELDAGGKPMRVGKHASQAGGWWWGIPVSTPDAQLSYKLARFITSYEMQRAECSNFGMMPVRKDVLTDLASAFQEYWMQDVFKAGLAQFEAGVTPPPATVKFAEMGSIWRKAWYDIVTQKGYSADGQGIDRAYIKKSLEPFAQKVQALKD
jgi:ABC-type glycerol-3-phosphate transport system substrate-binding protein